MGRDEIVTAVARAALLGARGNSGVILSQIVRGAAEELASRPGELVDPVLVSAAFARAADAAYASVRDPAEGTMLTAVRAMAQPGGARPRSHGHAAARPRVDAPRSRTSCSRRCSRTRSRPARRPWSAGPSSSPVLREAGVVDAGAYGLTVIIAGCLAALRGAGRAAARAPVRAGRAPPARARVVELPLLHELRRHRRRARRRAFTARARGDGRLRARGRRRPHAARAPPHRRPGRAVAVFDRPARCRASTSPTCTSRWPSAARGWRATARAASRRACAVVAVASGAGVQAPLRGARRARGGRRRRR